MNCPTTILKPGTRIRTHATLESMRGVMPTVEQMEARKTNVLGEVRGVAGGGGDIYWVRHDDGSEAPYCWSEFELEPVPELPERIFDDPREMHASLCKHVEETRHVVISADSAERRLIGFKCGCRMWWAVHVNGFRTFDVPNYMRLASQTFKAKQQWAAIINESRRKTAWEHLNDAGDDE